MTDASGRPTTRAQLFSGLALLISMASFVAGASLAKRLFGSIGAEGATTLRLVGGSLMLLVLMRPWRTLTGMAGTRAFILYGLAMGSMNLLFYMALTRVPLGIAVALEFSGPLVVTVLSSRAAADFLWLGIAVGGVLLLLPIGGGIHGIDPIGAALALGAGVCWAVYILAGKRAGEQHGIAATALGMSVGALAILPIGIARAGTALIQPEILLTGLGVALLSSALPYTLEMAALRHLKVQTYGTLTCCEPAIGSLAGLLLLHETLNHKQLFAIGLIIVAAAGATSMAARAKQERPLPSDLLVD